MTAKHAMFFALFTQGRVRVTLDGRAPGVDLPDDLKMVPILMLDYGLDLPRPTNDIQLADDGIRCTLSFNQIPRATFVPWAAIYAIRTDVGGIEFSESMPADIRELYAAAVAQKEQRKPTSFSLVPLEEPGESPAGETAAAAPALRIVKPGDVN